MKNPLPRNILIFHNGALGDFVLNWPMALAAGRLFPQSRVFYVTGGQKGKLAERALKVESRDSEEGWHRLHGRDPEVPESVGRLLDGAHSIFSFVHHSGNTWEQNVRRLAPAAQIYCLNPTPPAAYGGHATRFLLEQFAEAPAIHAAVEQIIRSIAGRGIGLAPAGETILLHPGSGSPRKCWPIERFGELAKRLMSNGHRVRVILGEVERERFSEAELDRLPAMVERLWLATPLQLFEQLKTARMLIGNDSGPGHLAGMMGVAVLSLFGPTSPAVWRPLGPRVGVLQHEPLEALSVDRVMSELEGPLFMG